MTNDFVEFWLCGGCGYSNSSRSSFRFNLNCFINDFLGILRWVTESRVTVLIRSAELIILEIIAEILSADAGPDAAAAINTPGLTRLADLDRGRLAAEQNTFGETFSDDGRFSVRCFPGIKETGFAELTGHLLGCICFVEHFTVRVGGGVEAAAGEAPSTSPFRIQF